MTEQDAPTVKHGDGSPALPRRAEQVGNAPLSSGRIAYFDNLKYVLIVLVVIGHYIDPFAATFPVYAPLFFFIYLFHMPLFVFSTGLFAQSLLRADGGFKVARVPQFLVLYLALYSGIWGLEALNGKDAPFSPWSVGNASWYLLACALWYLATPVLHWLATALNRRTDGSDAPGKRLVLAALVVIALAAGYFPAIGDFLSLSRVICFAPFFFLGFWLSREQVSAFALGGRRWRAAAGVVLGAALVLVYVLPVLLKVRGILTARNSYAVLEGYAAYGAGFRLIWLGGAVVLGAAVLCLVPQGRAWFTRLGERTLPIYLWHLLALRGLALVAFIPLVRGWYQVTPLAIVVPLVTALVAAHLFGVKPPFGMLADQLLRVGRGLTLASRAAVALSLAAVVALPVAAFAVSEKPVVIPLPRGLTPWVRPAPAPGPDAPPPPPPPTPVAVPDGSFELPLPGARGFAVVPTRLEPADGLPGGTLAPGEPYTIRRDDGPTWVVSTGERGGRLPAAEQLVNLPDLVPSIVYRSPPGFTSSGVAVDGADDLAPVSAPNPRLGKPSMYLPVSYPLAARLQRAQQAARANGDTLIVLGGFRPAGAQRALGSALLELYETDATVRSGIDPWSPSDFAPLVLSNHSLGVSVDVSLGRIASSKDVAGRDGNYAALTADPLPMPTPVHELSRAAAGLARPVKLVDGSEWTGVSPAPTLTDAALRLRDYLLDAGLAPSPGAWWEFTDWEARRAVPASSSGDFELDLP